MFPMYEQFHSGISPGAGSLFNSHSPAITSGSLVIGLLKPDILDDETVSIINDFNIMSGLWLRRRKSHNLVPFLNVQALWYILTLASRDIKEREMQALFQAPKSGKYFLKKNQERSCQNGPETLETWWQNRKQYYSLEKLDHRTVNIK